MILFGLLLVLLGGGARYVFLSRFLQEDLTQVVSAQQKALAEAVAQDIDDKLVDRLNLLQQLTTTLPPELLTQPARLEAWLAERHGLHPVFSLGLIVADPQGRIIADFPPITGRRGASLAAHADFKAVAEGGSGIGKPRRGDFSHQWMLPMGKAVKDAAGRTRAIMIGITALNTPGFLDRISHGRVGDAGGFLLVSPADKLFIAAGDPDLVMKPTPPPGVNPLHDKAMTGFRGTGITTNAKGVEELSAIVSVPSTGWFVVARMPTSEAFAPVRRAQDTVIRHSFTAMLMVLLVAGFFIRAMLGPLHRAAHLADRMTQGDLPLQPLPVVRNDEVGHLTVAFNQLLDKLRTSQVELERLAHHDSLTGLPNRILLADRMQQGLARARRNGTWIAVLYLDLDGFKPINDQLGHEAGDQALIEVAQRLSATLRSSDTLARIGGDEFVLLATDLSGDWQEGAISLASKCITTLSASIRLDGLICPLGASIGIAASAGHDTPEAILLAADEAMYDAKRAGRGRYAMASARPDSDPRGTTRIN
ncbi:GGDEF domain-containing protein [Zoogloea sp.]|uniref:GGDEF domain-containing protein n=1 Tax=Zoogloea sp. TaxID=49181 RepID=UPI0031FCCEBF